MNLGVLFEDNHCLAVNKPAGLPSQSDESRAESLVDVVTQYLKARYRKPGNVYVGLLHRLDRTTSGVLLLAKTSKAASRFRPPRERSRRCTGRSWRELLGRTKGNGSMGSRRTGD
jgi:23S rRNA-/tRNA-specific pseudouridylate synthase